MQMEVNSIAAREAFFRWPGWGHVGHACRVGTLFTVLFYLLYGGAAALTDLHSYRVTVDFPFEQFIPLLPVFSLVYLSVVAAMVIAPFILRDRKSYDAYARALFIQTAIAACIFIVFPVAVHYPAVSKEGIFAPLLKFADTINLNHNQLPSLHVAFAVTTALAFGKNRARLTRYTLNGWAWLLAASTLFTHQHHLLDLPAGFLLAQWACHRQGITEKAPLGLRYRADLRSLVFLALLLSLFLLHWSGTWRSTATYLLTFPLAFVACIITHNHMHLGLFRRRSWNGVFSCFLIFGSGQPPTGIITAHNVRHHKYQNSDADFVRTSLAWSRHNWINLLTFPFLSVATMIKEKPGDLRKWKIESPNLFRQALTERCIFLVVLGTTTVVAPVDTLVYLVAPWLFGQFCLIAVNLVQHQDCNHDSEWNHSRNVTGCIVNWFLLNNGYHTAHHRKPTLHWSLVPAYHDEVVALHIRPELNHRTLTGAIWNRLKAS
jgi:beta-carotene hydroxylase